MTMGLLPVLLSSLSLVQSIVGVRVPVHDTVFSNSHDFYRAPPTTFLPALVPHGPTPTIPAGFLRDGPLQCCWGSSSKTSGSSKRSSSPRRTTTPRWVLFDFDRTLSTSADLLDAFTIAFHRTRRDPLLAALAAKIIASARIGIVSVNGGGADNVAQRLQNEFPMFTNYVSAIIGYAAPRPTKNEHPVVSCCAAYPVRGKELRRSSRSSGGVVEHEHFFADDAVGNEDEEDTDSSSSDGAPSECSSSEAGGLTPTSTEASSSTSGGLRILFTDEISIMDEETLKQDVDEGPLFRERGPKKSCLGCGDTRSPVYAAPWATRWHVANDHCCYGYYGRYKLGPAWTEPSWLWWAVGGVLDVLGVGQHERLWRRFGKNEWLKTFAESQGLTIEDMLLVDDSALNVAAARELNAGACWVNREEVDVVEDEDVWIPAETDVMLDPRRERDHVDVPESADGGRDRERDVAGGDLSWSRGDSLRAQGLDRFGFGAAGYTDAEDLLSYLRNVDSHRCADMPAELMPEQELARENSDFADLFGVG